MILVPLAAMFGYIAFEVWLGSMLSLWRTDVVKDTILWVIASGVVLYFKCREASTDPLFFRRTAIATVEVAVFLQFFMNLVVLSLPAELILQPILAALVVFSTLGSLNKEHRNRKLLTDGLLALVGFWWCGFTILQLYRTWNELDETLLFLQFILPTWLTIGLLPFIDLLSLYAEYDLLFRRINWATKDFRARWRARLVLATRLHFRTSVLHAFNGYWVTELTAAPSFTASRDVIAGFQRLRRETEQAMAREQEQLERYAGSDETDAEGRRLDRREFKETMKALQWLETCQMGWYRNGGRYRDDLLKMIGGDFTWLGLPKDARITMKVAKDGQSWYGWRRTISGWCFGIGATGAASEPVGV